MNHLIDTARRWAMALFLAAALSGAAGAHPGHGESIPREEAVRRADAQIGRLVTGGKLEKSWALEAKLQSADLKGSGGGKEWVLTYANAAAAQPDKKLLYVFLSETGEYLAANFTGR